MRKAIYAGSFDPITNGHLSVVTRARELFDELVVLVAVNPGKSPWFSLAERLEFIAAATSAWPTVSCDATEGYVVEYAQNVAARYLVRGVRGCTDMETELQLAACNHELAPDIETVFVPAHRALAEVSSSRLKEYAMNGGDIAAYCPSIVAARLLQRASASCPKSFPVERTLASPLGLRRDM